MPMVAWFAIQQAVARLACDGISAPRVKQSFAEKLTSEMCQTPAD
jgi:hypothetical protein